MKYFTGDKSALETDEETRPLPLKFPVPDGDELPFGYLDDRRFEVLCYRLKIFEHRSTDNRVALMKGVGERGRDVVVYGADGRVREIIQCKNLEKRFTAPELRKELLKLALHSFLDPSILDGSSVGYELWCPNDLTEPAAALIDTWPRGWTSAALAESAKEVITTYQAFSALIWSDIGEGVTHDFAQRVRVKFRGGVDLSLRTRACLSVYEDYFAAKVVMSRDDVFAAVRATVAEATGYAQLTDEDAKHMITRVTSFPADQRVVHASGYVMGLPVELMSRLHRPEFELFTRHAMQATTGIVEVVLKAGQRIADEFTRLFREECSPQHREVAPLLARTMVASMIDRVQGTIMLVKRFRLMGEDYSSLSFRQRMSRHIRESWESYQRCIAGYDPSKHAYASDEEFRNRIAVTVLDGANTLDEFAETVERAIDAHLPELEARFSAFMELFPTQIMVITDTMTIFDNDQLMTRMVETIKSLEKMRGTPTLPE